VTYPSRIIDLHTHLFNARYVPLASVIANAMKKDSSPLADRAAALLEEMTGSSYTSDDFVPMPTDPDEQDAYLLDKIWAIARFELSEAGPAPALVGAPDAGDTSDGIDAGRIMQAIVDLSKIDYAAEGWAGEVPPRLPTQAGFVSPSASDILAWAGKVLRMALHIVAKLMEPGAWGHVENYLEFFLTMLKSEQALLDKIFEGYGKGLPQLQVVHFMMGYADGLRRSRKPALSLFPEAARQHEENGSGEQGEGSRLRRVRSAAGELAGARGVCPG